MRKNKFTLYFAYGANLNLNGMAHRCPGFKPIAPAALPDYRLVFKGVADVEPVPHGRNENVYGALYLLTSKHMKSLDSFEGFPNFYVKKEVLVRILDGLEPKNFTLATIYIMRNNNHYAEPNWQYLNTILTGCRQWELPEEYQEEIILRAYHPHLITQKEICSLK